ncbi:MAG: D-alanyl-D-alanine carboxypeptidase [Clostridiales bacterium]|nr:D-alanyl-D-alanine carboxypeptidase [Clostridiales bacterium]
MQKTVKIIVFFISFIIISLLFSSKSVYADASSYIVIETSTNRILDGNNIDKKSYMASTTKILTAITAIENKNVEDTVIIPKKACGIEGSSIYLEENEKLSLKQLLYGLMLRSGNDSAVAIALSVSNTINDFANLMNITAKKIGAYNSNFVNPHGLHDDNHYTTAKDLALISSYAIKNPIFKEIVSTKSIKIPWTTRNTTRLLINKNKLLSKLDGATGIKTGFTKKAGRCLVTSCYRNGMEVVSVVLNCPDMWDFSEKIINTSFNNYSMYKLVEADNVIDFINVNGENEKCGLYIKNDIVLPLTKEEFDNVKIVYNHIESISKPFEKDKNVGSVDIYIKNKLLFSEKMFTIIKK